MKSKYIVYVFVAVILILAGIFTCVFANGFAASNGITLYSVDSDRNGNRFFSESYDSASCRKLNFLLGDANVNIYQGSEEKIEYFNFTKGSFSKGSVNNVLTISNNMSLEDMMKEGSFNSGFDGLRHYIHNFGVFGRKKTVNIYITENTNLNAVQVTLDGGTIKVSDLVFKGDIIVSTLDGEFSVSGSDIKSSVKINGTKCSTNIVGGYIRKVICDLESGSFSLDGTETFATDIAIEKGDARFVIESVPDPADTELTTRRGSVKVCGEDAAEKYAAPVYDEPEDTDGDGDVTGAVTKEPVEPEIPVVKRIVGFSVKLGRGDITVDVRSEANDTQNAVDSGPAGK